MRTRNYLFYLLRDPCFSQVVASVNMDTCACESMREKIHARSRALAHSFTRSMCAFSFVCHHSLSRSGPLSRFSALLARIPLMGAFFSSMLNLVFSVQRYYFYTSAS